MANFESPICPPKSFFKFVLGTSLTEMGDSLKQMADVKYALDDNIKQNFLEPLHHLQTKDLKEVMVILFETITGIFKITLN